MTNLRRRMLEELQRRNYSPATIRGYILAIKQFAEYFGKPPDRLGATHVQRFQWYLLQERRLNPGTVEMRMSALRFFFKKMLKRRDMHFDDPAELGYVNETPDPNKCAPSSVTVASGPTIADAISPSRLSKTGSPP